MATSFITRSDEHTPGPWKADFKHIGHVKASNGAVVAKCNKLTSFVNMEANARLMAAAPDLLETLQACEEYFDNRADADCDQDGFIPNPELRLLGIVRDVLKKAGA